MSNELTTQSWQSMKSQAMDLVRSGGLPSSIKTPEQAAAIMLKGRELGLPTMESFSQIHMIKGKPSISAQAMMGLIFKNCPGAVINFLVMTGSICEIEAARPNCIPIKFSFSIEDAKRAGLLSNDSWRKYPVDMLRSRCVSQMARALFPDCISGVGYTPEELGATVDGDGEVIDAESVPTIDTIYIGADHQKQFLKDALVEAQVPVEQWAQIHKLVCEAEVACGDIPIALTSILKEKIPDAMMIGHEETPEVNT